MFFLRISHRPLFVFFHCYWNQEQKLYSQPLCVSIFDLMSQPSQPSVQVERYKLANARCPQGIDNRIRIIYSSDSKSQIGIRGTLGLGQFNGQKELNPFLFQAELPPPF